MKGDFSRQTFARKNHYSSVRMQQGRVQLDADWNEQADIVTHRSVTATRDLIGPCGGPQKGAAFQVRTIPGRVIEPTVEVPGRTADEGAERPTIGAALRPGATVSAAKVSAAVPDARAKVVNPSGLVPIRPPRKGVTNVGDFFLGAGHYYVAGILCENEQDVRFSQQPDLPEATTLGDAPYDAEALYLLYLDVWQRHLTALDDPRIRETALGGPDTATRTKSVWQAKLWKVPARVGIVCPDVFGTFMRTEAGRNKGLLNASSVPEDPGSNPCIVPPSAGYRGLENLLYRVEVHTGGQAADVSTNDGSVAVTSFGSSARNELTVEAGLTPQAGDAVELYAAKAGSDPLKGRLFFVTGVSDKTLTLSRDIKGFEMSQQPRLRKVSATYKWSRQNGVVVTKVENISSEDNKQITVQSLGPDDDLGFSDGDWVELTDDATELHGRAGQLTQIVSADSASRTVVLKDAPAVAVSRNAKMRRWDGLGPIRMNPADSEMNWIELENGLRIQFPKTGADNSKPGAYATGDYWLIPTRTATADRESGQIEWPFDGEGNPLSQPPAGIEHHYCPLALLNWNKTNGVTVVNDCRHLFPAVTELTTLNYVSGTGQEAMPVLAPPAQGLVELLHPLVVGVSNGSAPVAGARVVFEVVEGEINAAAPAGGSDFPNGRLSAVSGGNALTFTNTKIEVRTGPDGLASCKWELSTSRWNQQVVATLLGEDARTPVHLPVRFNANLSVASEVAYKPGKCDKLAGFRTVQDALDELCRLVGFGEEPGMHVVDVGFGATDPPFIDRVRGAGEAGPIQAGSPGVRRDVTLPGKPDGKIENDFDLACDVLAGGLYVICDRDILPLSVMDKPICSITLELPFPFSQSDKQAWGLKPEEKAFIGYQSIVLDGSTGLDGRYSANIITWRPSSFTANWLREILTAMFGKFDPKVEGSRRPGRILGRLTLKGNFILSLTDPMLHLDGELFGGTRGEGGNIGVLAPSGDGRRGGDLELWFWLVNFEVRLEQKEINVGEGTTGVVSLSGPAPRGGATITLSVSNATVAKLEQTTVKLREGEVDARFEVAGLQQGQVMIHANYARGQKQVGLSVSVSPPPRVEAVRIHSTTFTTVNTELAKMDSSTGLPPERTLTISPSVPPNAVEVKFTDDAPINFNTVTNTSFLVQAASTGRLITGNITPVIGSNAVMWRGDGALPPGDYRVILVGDVDGITSVRGRRLDGEPRQLPSGEGQEGGNFSFILRVQAFQPAASPLKVKRVRILGKSTAGVEAVIFESKEGDFNASIVLKKGEQPHTIEFEFTGGPVNKSSVIDRKTLFVRKIDPAVKGFELRPGDVSWLSDNVVRWIKDATQGLKTPTLEPGLYNIALFGGKDPVTNVTTSDNIKAVDGRMLDGEPKQLPSGDNKEGGTFAFTLQVI